MLKEIRTLIIERNYSVNITLTLSAKTSYLEKS